MAEQKDIKEKKKYLKRKYPPLTLSMIMLLISCWILPFTMIAYIILNMTVNKINTQIEDTIVASADNAVKICEMRMKAAVNSSRDASSLTTIRDAYGQYMKDANFNSFYGKITTFLEQHYCYDENFLNTTLVFTDKPTKPFCVSRLEGVDKPARRDRERYMEKVHPLVMKIYPKLDTGIRFLNVENHIYMVRNIMDSDYHPYAVIIMELDKDSIFGSMESIWGYVAGEIYVDKKLLISDRKNQDVNNNALFTDKEPPSEIVNAKNRKAKLLQDGGEYYVYLERKPERQRIGYVMQLDKQAIIDETENLKIIGQLLVLLMVPLIIVVFLFFGRKVTKPVKWLVDAALLIERGQFGYQIHGTGNSKEFAYLLETFNSMSLQLKNQFETIYSEELALKDARIMALQLQINPHFLNNTLEIINWEARINGNYKVSQMIENLSIMLEATMDRRHRRFVTLAEEMSYVEAYLFIIAQRLGERLSVEKNIDNSLLNVKVPRLIIQPIIENAVEHGINGQTHGKITIRAFAEGDKLMLEVRNTGMMSKQDEEKIQILLGDDYEPGEFGSASLGIRNVNRRIKIIYGETCGLFVQNDEKGETVSTIIVKLDYDNNKRQ